RARKGAGRLRKHRFSGTNVRESSKDLLKGTAPLGRERRGAAPRSHLRCTRFTVFACGGVGPAASQAIAANSRRLRAGRRVAQAARGPQSHPGPLSPGCLVYPGAYALAARSSSSILLFAPWQWSLDKLRSLPFLVSLQVTGGPAPQNSED